ncbi:MptD family putative ECF transporter S component [Slackia exigua]|uniref:MptD family putative ECF transporter S component n=1 Tax=Slackia exigua TaxID=84109 RepID=UPI002550F9D2|nr:MptD family putative ECF transporter S component [Slackia exigua]MDK7723918.1 MptD family putative ECF transporter S component [Slackia exigua]MDK7725149.1 MptD family putative ECF transporter S component [Slackia exigua]
MKKDKTPAIGPRDLVSIGVFGALSLLIFFVVGGIAGLTVVGTVANIPIVCFFTSIVYLLLAAKVKKPGTFLIMGTINVLPGLMAANVLGVLGSIAGWAVAEAVATRVGYANRRGLVAAYVTGCTLQSALYTLPIYLSATQYLSERQEILRLTDETMAQFVALFSGPMYAGMVALTIATSLAGALISLKVMKKHFERAGIV